MIKKSKKEEEEFLEDGQFSDWESRRPIVATPTFKGVDKYKSAESMFWVEILQRGRSILADFNCDVDYCNDLRMYGLSLIEWFGFIDKFYSEAPRFNTSTGRLTSQEPFEDQIHWIIDETQDPRFQKPTDRSLRSLFPEFQEAMKNTKLDEHLRLKRDPRVIEASLRKFINNFSAKNTSVSNFSNRFRRKPTGAQEDYLAKLMTRVSSNEMKQVIQKKLYEDDKTVKNEEEIAEDSLASILIYLVKGQEYIVAPTYNLPAEYRVPNFAEHIEDALETDSENEEEFERDKDDWSVPGDTESGGDYRDEDNSHIAHKRSCRVCEGMNLEPMNGPLLLQLIDDCGFIFPRRQTGFCLRHQRKIAGVLARSVAMGVLEWKEGVVKYLDPFRPVAHPEEIKIPSEVRKRLKNNK